MAKYSENEIPNMSEDWGLDSSDEKLRPYSNGAVQRFLKAKIQEQIENLEGKIGWLSYEGGNIVFYDKQDGNQLGALTLSGTIYSIDLASDTKTTFFILTSETTRYLSITPSSKSGTIGGSMSDYIEDYTYTISVDNGSGTFKDILNGECTNGSNFRFDIRNYVTTGSNRIRVIVTGKESKQSKAMVFTCNVTNLSLTCTYSWYKPFIEGQTYYIDKIFFGGNLQKTLYVRIDNDDNQTYTITFSSGTNYLTSEYSFNMSDKFPSTGSGVHSLEVWMAGEGVETEHFYYNIMCISKTDVNKISLVCLNEIPSKAVNYNSQTLFKYATYNSTNVTFNIYGMDNGNKIPVVTDETLKVQTQTKISYDANLEMSTESKEGVILHIEASVEGCKQTKELNVDNSNSYAAVDNPTFHLDCTNRSNNSANRLEFINSSNSSNIDVSSYSADWSGFAWSTDGWSTDGDGNKCLAVNAGSTIECKDMQPLNITSTFNQTIEFKFRCSNVADYDTPIFSFMDTDVYNSETSNGIILFPTKVLVLGNENRNINSQSVNLDEDELCHIIIVFQRNYNNSGHNLCRIYINSYQNAVFEYSGSANFGKGHFRIGQKSADTYLFMLRYYNQKVLEEADVLGNFLNTLIDGTEYNRIGVRKDNTIIDGGVIDYDLCKKAGFNTMIVQTKGDSPIPSIDYTSSINTTLTMEYNDHPEWNFTIENAPCDGQGTTSKKYYRWNLRWKLKDAAIWTYSDGSTTTKKGKFDGGNHPNISTITAKKNIASSSQGHKMGATNFYDELYSELGLKAALPSVTTRVAVYEYPAMGFQKFADGTYEFIGLYTIGPDKGDSNTFGYDSTSYPNYLSLEGPNHAPLGTRFLHPWTDDTIYVPADETLTFGGQEGWDVDSCPYDTAAAASQEPIQALLTAEWKPAFDIVYYNSLYIRSLSELGYTLTTLNNNIQSFRGSMNVLINKKNEVLQLYDENYNLIYYDNTISQYKILPNFNIVEYLGTYLSTTQPTTAQIIEARKNKFKAEVGNYFSIDSATFHECFCELIGASDNHSKNTYPFKLKTLAEGGRWEWRQDDLDTVLATDNNGLSTKSYSIEVGDVTADGTDIFQGASSAFWNLINEVFATEKKAMMNSIFNSCSRIASNYNISSAYLHDTIYNVFWYYFWQNSSEYFPALAYAKDATWSYIEPWYKDSTKTYNNVYPLTQALGTQKDAEQLWVKRRIIYIMSQYQIGPFTGSGTDGLSSIEFTPAEPFTFNLTPAYDMYPSANKGGGQDVKGSRTNAGEVCEINADSDGSTTFYLKSLDLLTDIGDLSGLKLTTRGGDSTVGAAFSIASKKLKSLKVGDTDASKVIFNASSLTLSAPCIETIDARNVSSIKNNISLLNCPRLKKAYFNGTNATALVLPKGGKIDYITYPEQLQTLFLHSLPLLTNSNMILSDNTVNNITSMYYYNCANIDPFTLLRLIYNNGSKLKFITMIWDNTIQGTSADLEMIRNFTKPYDALTDTGYGSVEYDNENNLITNSSSRTNLQGAINISGYAYEDTITDLKNYFGSNLSLTVLGYYIRFVDAILQQILLDNGIGDGVGITKTACENANSIPSFENNADITSFNELQYFSKITNIPSYNFNNCTALTSVTSNNLIQMGREVFENCTSLTSISLPNLTNIGDNAFKTCSSLTAIDFPNLTIMGSSSFENCSSLTSISLPNATNMGNGVFNTCTLLTSIVLPNIISIGSSCFANCSSLTSISLPKLTSIETSSFENCTSLTSISLPNATKIGHNGFKTCSALTSISLPNITSIETSIFESCTSLTTIEIPKLENLSEYAFYACSSLSSISLPKVTTIGNSSFENCSSLTSISFPNVTTMGERVFRTCTSLTSISLSNLTKIGNNAFKDCSALTAIDLPKLTNLGDSSFESCTALTTISLPNATNIGEYNFYNCTALNSISFSKVTTIGINAFKYCSSLTDINYDGTIAQWNAITKADGWCGTISATVHCSDGNIAI